MRSVADQLRGKDINKAFSILKFSPKEAAKFLEKLFFPLFPIGSQKMKKIKV